MNVLVIKLIFNSNANAAILNSQAMVYSSMPQEPEPTRSSMSKLIENPDPNFICTQAGKFPTRRYCNVYYECSDAGLPPTCKHMNVLIVSLIVVKVYVCQKIKSHV